MLSAVRWVCGLRRSRRATRAKRTEVPRPELDPAPPVAAVHGHCRIDNKGRTVREGKRIDCDFSSDSAAIGLRLTPSACRPATAWESSPQALGTASGATTVGRRFFADEPSSRAFAGSGTRATTTATPASRATCFALV
jgi:hypothetical protein